MEAGEHTGVQVTDSGMSNISDLPQDVLVSILLRMDVKDIAMCACVCTSLRAVAMDESKIWEPLCTCRWGSTTNLKKWLKKKKKSRGASFPGTFSAKDYRTLCFMLIDLEPMKGLWKTKGEGPYGYMYWIHWCEDGLSCSHLMTGDERHGNNRGLEINYFEVLKFGSGSAVTGEVLDDKHLLISDYTRCLPSVSCSGAAAAAASVAVGSLSEAVTGESPPQSHEVEMQKFMNSFLLQRGRRKSSGGLSGKGYAGGLLPKTLYLVKVVNPKPTRNTSLSGLWKGLYGPHGVEVISVEYNFTGHRAKIVATKVIGDPNVPAGECTWEVSARPNPSEMHEYEFFHPSNDETILNYYLGVGCIANHGYVNPQRVKGILLEYEDGHIGFVWDHAWLDVLHYARLDGHFLS